MGVLNVTPDSFSDGGRWNNVDAAIARAIEMVEQGAGIIDIGGESTRPGAQPISLDDELRRVLPVVHTLAKRVNVPISIDTSKADVIREGLAMGATMVNDVRALSSPGALQAVAGTDAAVCLMHMQGEPGTMQSQPQYRDVVPQVRDFLHERIKACHEAGIELNRIVIDPGIGFGKRLEHNLELLRRLGELLELGHPVLVGISRKSLVGTITGRPVSERLAGSVAFATAAALAGASIIRAHDVSETVDAVRVAVALKQSTKFAGEQR